MLVSGHFGTFTTNTNKKSLSKVLHVIQSYNFHTLDINGKMDYKNFHTTVKIFLQVPGGLLRLQKIRLTTAVYVLKNEGSVASHLGRFVLDGSHLDSTTGVSFDLSV